MTKVYNSKSNAVRAFRTAYPVVAANLDNAQIRTDYLDEDNGGFVLIDPATVQANDDEEQARADAEYTARKEAADKAAAEVAAQEAVIETKASGTPHPFIKSITSTDHKTTAIGAAQPKADPTPKRPGAGVKIETNREMRNGIKRPSAGGVCREVWDECDAMQAAGTAPTVKALKELAPAKGWNANNAAIEFYQWRKFHGITGRVK